MTSRPSLPSGPLDRRLVGIVRDSPWLMSVLSAVRGLGLGSWCVGAGAVRGLVWDTLHGFTASMPEDVDVVYFDASMGPESDAELERELRSCLPAVPWEVTNQAVVHRWFEARLGMTVAPLQSLEQGIATWPEYATCVGVTLKPDGSIGVVAPHGLEDLFGLLVRHNPCRASAATYRQRVTEKRFAERWPKLSILPA
jgi:hypothetical protein